MFFGTEASIGGEGLLHKGDLAGIEQLGLSPELVAEMVNNFQNSNAAARAFLTQQLERTIEQQR